MPANNAENIRLAAWANGTAAVIVNIQRQPGTNVIEVVDRIKQLLPKLQEALPSGLDVALLTDRTTTIRASVEDVQIELLLALAAGGAGYFLIFTQRFCNRYPRHRGAAVVNRHLRSHVSGRFQHQQSDADGADHRHRFRG